MAKLEITDSGILYINPDPAHYHVFASHPHPLQLSEQEYLCTYQRGAGLYSTDMNVSLLRSQDGGVTWADEGPLHETVGDDRPYSYHDGMITRMRDGTIVVLVLRADRSDPSRTFFSDTGGLIDNAPVLLFSNDEGHTWTRPLPMNLPEGLVATPANPVVELEDGTWMATFDQWHAHGDHTPYKPRMLALFSGDRGRSWGDMVVIADGGSEGKGYWHGKTLRLADGRLYTLFWAADMTDPEQGPVSLAIHHAFTDKTGRRWDQPTATNLPGQTNYTAELPDGKLCAIYTLRESKQPGFMVALSDDAGASWDLDNQVRVWDATGWEQIGISSPDKYPRSHDTIAFGAPTIMTTLEGDLYASWWCTYASLTHPRWARLKVID